MLYGDFASLWSVPFVSFYLSSPSALVIEQHPRVAGFGASSPTSMACAPCSHCLRSPVWAVQPVHTAWALQCGLCSQFTLPRLSSVGCAACSHCLGSPVWAVQPVHTAWALQYGLCSLFTLPELSSVGCAACSHCLSSPVWAVQPVHTACALQASVSSSAEWSGNIPGWHAVQLVTLCGKHLALCTQAMLSKSLFVPVVLTCHLQSLSQGTQLYVGVVTVQILGAASFHAWTPGGLSQSTTPCLHVNT